MKKSNFLNPNWSAINKAIAGSNEDRDALRKQQRELKQKIDEKFSQYFKEVKAQELKDKITALKALPVGADVYSLIKYGKIPYGSKGKKLKDGKKFMIVSMVIVDVEGNVKPGSWKIEYNRLAIQSLSSIEKENHELSKKITDLVFSYENV